MFSVWKKIFGDEERKKVVIGKTGNIVLIASELPVILTAAWNAPTLRILKHQLLQLKLIPGEGINSALYGCKLLSDFEQFRNPALVNCTLSYLLQFISQYVEKTRKPTQTIQVKTLVEIASNHLNSKLKHYFSQKDIQYLSIVIAEAVLQSIGCTLKCSLLAGEVKRSKVVKGKLN